MHLNQAHYKALTTDQAIGIDDSYLVDFNCEPNKNWLIHPAIKQPLTQLLQQAKQDGINIAIVSAYRSFDRQLAIWNAKWQGSKAILSAQNQVLDSSRLTDLQKFKAICHFSALPGFSRHHWGTDLDIFCADAIAKGHAVELIESEFAESGPCAKLNLWLQTNLEKLGFYRPYLNYQQGVAAEPWHISHYQTSQNVLHNFDKASSFEVLKSAEIESKEFIQGQLEHYYQQYFCNLCEPENANLLQEDQL